MDAAAALRNAAALQRSSRAARVAASFGSHGWNEIQSAPISGARAPLTQIAHEAKENSVRGAAYAALVAAEGKPDPIWAQTEKNASARVTLHIPIHEAREMSFYEDRAGTFWVLYSSNNGLAIFDRQTRRLTRVSFASSAHARSDLSESVNDACAPTSPPNIGPRFFDTQSRFSSSPSFAPCIPLRSVVS